MDDIDISHFHLQFSILSKNAMSIIMRARQDGYTVGV